MFTAPLTVYLEICPQSYVNKERKCNVLNQVTSKNVRQGKFIAVVYTLRSSHNSFLWSEYFIDYLCERWIPCQALTETVQKMCTLLKYLSLHYSLGYICVRRYWIEGGAIGFPYTLLWRFWTAEELVFA